ncbi:MAG: Dabb family protein [Reichenbachiella sp.]
MKDTKNNFTHTVLFWFKEPDNQSNRALFESSITEFINDSLYVQFSHIGTPAGTDRDVVDSSYTYSLLVTFESVEDQDKYQVEEAHVKFIEACKELWTKVQVYDSLSI